MQGLTNLKNSYLPHLDDQLQVCTDNGCESAIGHPSGIERLDPSVCPSRCNKSSGTWVRVVPGVCLNLPNNKYQYKYLNVQSRNSNIVFSNKYDCETNNQSS